MILIGTRQTCLSKVLRNEKNIVKFIVILLMQAEGEVSALDSS